MSLNYFDGTNLQNIAGAKTIEVDDVPTANSENPVSSGGVKTALDEKLNRVNGTMTYNYKAGAFAVGVNANNDVWVKNTPTGTSGTFHSIVGGDGAFNLVTNSQSAVGSIHHVTSSFNNHDSQIIFRGTTALIWISGNVNSDVTNPWGAYPILYFTLPNNWNIQMTPIMCTFQDTGGATAGYIEFAVSGNLLQATLVCKGVKPTSWIFAGGAGACWYTGN